MKKHIPSPPTKPPLTERQQLAASVLALGKIIDQRPTIYVLTIMRSESGRQIRAVAVIPIAEYNEFQGVEAYDITIYLAHSIGRDIYELTGTFGLGPEEDVLVQIENEIEAIFGKRIPIYPLA